MIAFAALLLLIHALSEAFTVLLYALTAVAIAYFLKGWMGPVGAGVFACAVALGLGFVVPYCVNYSTETTLRAETSPQIAPVKRLLLAGNVYIDDVQSSPYVSTRKSRDKPLRFKNNYALASTCGALCRALLATPGVTSVTVDEPHSDRRSTPSAEAVTYRRSAGLCGPFIQESRDIIGRKGIDVRFPSIDCVMGSEPIRNASFRIVSYYSDSESWILPNFTESKSFEIYDHDSLVYKEASGKARYTDLPLRAFQLIPDFSPSYRIFKIQTYFEDAGNYWDNKIDHGDTLLSVTNIRRY